MKHARSLFAQGIEGLINDPALNHAAADGADNTAVITDQHLRGMSGSGATTIDDLCQRERTVLCFESCRF